jgi:hypothetical protein
MKAQKPNIRILLKRLIVLTLFAVLLTFIAPLALGTEDLASGAEEQGSGMEDQTLETEDIDEGNETIVSLLLPNEIPFSIVIPRYGGLGFVESDEFYITNNGEYGIEVTLDNAQVILFDRESFSIATNSRLPDSGNCIYLELICTQNDTVNTYPLTDYPQTTHTYWLESGESAAFCISGTVSEYDEVKWSETRVMVSI